MVSIPLRSLDYQAIVGNETEVNKKTPNNKKKKIYIQPSGTGEVWSSLRFHLWHQQSIKQSSRCWYMGNLISMLIKLRLTKGLWFFCIKQHWDYRNISTSFKECVTNFKRFYWNTGATEFYECSPLSACSHILNLTNMGENAKKAECSIGPFLSRRRSKLGGESIWGLIHLEIIHTDHTGSSICYCHLIILSILSFCACVSVCFIMSSIYHISCL